MTELMTPSPTALMAGPRLAPRLAVSLAGVPGGLFGSAPAPAAAYPGPERRRTGSVLHQLLAHMLDEVDYGMLLVSIDGQVLLVNKSARRDLDAQHPLQLVGPVVQARQPGDQPALRDALAAASQRGLRRLVTLGERPARCTVAVVPLPTPDSAGQGTVLLLLAKRQMCQELSVDCFARSHGLTLTETQVLKGLCEGLLPQAIAARQGVKLATVRTQIGSIRAKTGTDSIRALVALVARLPPLVSSLHVGGQALAA
jgi:DNA-binding CsgD family transcriptional regulator